jgi:GNAT superfamily N-acetyltransferase
MAIECRIMQRDEFSSWMDVQVPSRRHGRGESVQQFELRSGLAYLGAVCHEVNTSFWRGQEPFVAVATEEGEFVGYGSATPFSKGPGGSIQDCITALAVRASHRGRGISSMLLEALADEVVVRHAGRGGEGTPVLELSTLSEQGEFCGNARLVGPLQRLLEGRDDLALQTSDLDRSNPLLDVIRHVSKERIARGSADASRPGMR